jgi:hypothetical protein
VSKTHETPDPATTDGAPLSERPIVNEYTDGGHEIDRPPSMTLFGFLVAMGILIVIVAFGVFQLFVSHEDEQSARVANDPVTQRVEQAQRDELYMTTYGVVSAEGQPDGYRMPIMTAKELVLKDPSRFAAAAPPAGWVHPDDAAAPPPPAPEKE